MILWVVLAVCVVAISFVLALNSMRDFTEVSREGEEYSLFLIRQNTGLNAQLLNSIHDDLLSSGSIISFERLVKGQKSALAVFGPKKLLMGYKDFLNLLELEDYASNVNIKQAALWEVGIKNISQFDTTGLKNSLFLSEDEQFWWQLVLWVNKSSSKLFQVQIRAVVVSLDPQKRKSLTQTLQNLPNTGLIKLPKAFSDAQLIDFYKKRSFQKSNTNLSLNSEGVLRLI